MEGDEEFHGAAGPGKENPLVEIGDKLCPEDEQENICSGHGTCKLGKCLSLLHNDVRTECPEMSPMFKCIHSHWRSVVLVLVSSLNEEEL